MWTRGPLRSIRCMPVGRIGSTDTPEGFRECRHVETRQTISPLGVLYQSKLGWWRVAGVEVRVGIVDARRDCGRLRFEVEPIHGRKTTWVNASAVVLDATEERTGTHA